jgi:hypothetical protein
MFIGRRVGDVLMHVYVLSREHSVKCIGPEEEKRAPIQWTQKRHAIGCSFEELDGEPIFARSGAI